jgi:hypothetical protein
MATTCRPEAAASVAGVRSSISNVRPVTAQRARAGSGISAYILNLNGLLPADATLDAKSLGAIKMPNRNMFVSDPRPDVKNPACMTGC